MCFTVVTILKLPAWMSLLAILRSSLQTPARHTWQSQGESGSAHVPVGGGGAVTLATQLHILQRLPQRKNVFLQHAITTDYRLLSLHQKLFLGKKKHSAFVCVCFHTQPEGQTDRETKKDEK